jgi:hypothetical protein
MAQGFPEDPESSAGITKSSQAGLAAAALLEEWEKYLGNIPLNGGFRVHQNINRNKILRWPWRAE